MQLHLETLKGCMNGQAVLAIDSKAILIGPTMGSIPSDGKNNYVNKESLIVHTQVVKDQSAERM